MAIAERTEEQVKTLTLRNELLESENKILRELNDELRKWRFGRSTERLEPGQLTFLETGQCPDEPQEEPVAPAKKARKPKKGHGRAAFPDQLDRVEHRHELSGEDLNCSDCGTTMQQIGEDVTERGRLIPARMVVDRHVRPKYACPHGHGVKSAGLPKGVVEGGKYGPSVYAHIATAKYNDHMPLNRLEGIFARHGMKIPKQTMWDMLKRLDQLVAQPVLKQMRSEMLEEPILHADETPVSARIEGQKVSKKAWIWGWRNEPGGERPPKALIEFHLGRGKQVPADFLGDWGETLLTDGFASYNPICEVNGITRAGCWAHARRYFLEALKSGAKAAAPILGMVNRLFALERGVRKRAERRKLDHEAMIKLRGIVRLRSAKPLVLKMLKQAEELQLQRTTLPKSKLGKAVGYLVNQQVPLGTFLSDARVPIHNNDEERDLRHIVVGRNNWMIFASQLGGEVASRLYSIVLSCRQNKVNPEAYFESALVAVTQAGSSGIDFENLTPWAWKKGRGEEAKGD